MNIFAQFDLFLDKSEQIFAHLIFIDSNNLFIRFSYVEYYIVEIHQTNESIHNKVAYPV